MIKQLARSIEMVVLKQLFLMTGHNDAKSSGLNIKYEDEKLIEMWVGATLEASHMTKQFKITIEEIE